MVHRMKTTVELPDRLVLNAKKAALERGTTLRALIECGLTRELKNPSKIPSQPLEGIRQLDASVWEGTQPDSYVSELREGWE